MKRPSYKEYILLGIALFLLASLPAFVVEKFRGTAFAITSWIFRGTSKLVSCQNYEKERLEGENHLLRLEVGKLRALLEQREKWGALSQELRVSNLSPHRCAEIEYLSDALCQAVPARVIYRDPGSWSSTVWVNVGEATNQVLGHAVIQKNSPVILGRSVVGAVDYVGNKQSRIRLISDVSLNPSVRAARGYQHNMFLVESIDGILRYLNTRNDTVLSHQEKLGAKTALETIKEKVLADSGCWSLAKGVLQGSAVPLGRSSNYTLRGVGFNYDFPDAEGPARELTTGKVMHDQANLPAVPIIQESDILVTTGMDGVFPPGLRVAEVTKIFPLREGGYAYEIEAIPVVGNLDALQMVFIIPPVGFQKQDFSCSTFDFSVEK